MIRERRKIIQRNYLISASLLEVISGIILFLAIPLLKLHECMILYRAGYVLSGIGIFMFLLYITFYLTTHCMYKGTMYAVCHIIMMEKLRTHLKDAGYYVERSFRGEKTCVLPRIKIKFDKDVESGKIYIRNNIRQNQKLENVDISSALGRFIVTEQYLTMNADWYVYEFEDAVLNAHLTFYDYQELAAYAKETGNYKLFMDKRTRVPLSSMLLVGATGSGKTYALYTLILQMMNWNNKPTLSFADPKNSSLVVLGNHLSPENTAGEITDIISLLERFHERMEERKAILKKELEGKLNADYRDFGMTAEVFIFDEYASFSSCLATLDTSTRKKVSMLLRNIVLQGRQLGFFLWIVMQKSSAEDIPTSIRSNLLLKIVLGRADRTTYQTAFEDSAKEVKALDLKQGEGLYYYPGRTRSPKRMSFPTLDFDILKSIGNGLGVL